MLVRKHLVSPGTYWYVDQDTGLPKKLIATPELIQYWHRTGKEMRGAGLSIPVPLEHDLQALPMTAVQKAAKQLRDNTGEVKDFELLDGKHLFSVIDIQDADIAKKLGRSIRWTSPYFTTFVDGDGKEWKGVIGHVALTSKPRITKQQPFPTIAAAMSYAATLTIPPPKPEEFRGGMFISRAGRLVERDGHWSPRYPVAFSLVSGGIALALADLKKDEKYADDPPATPKEMADSPPVDPNAPQALIDSDGDIDIEMVLAGLLGAAGISMPETGTKESFMEDAYKALMEFIKGKVGGAPMGDVNNPNANQPANGTKNDLPRNPIIQEQPPMFMSLADIREKSKTVADPVARELLNAMLSHHETTATQTTALRDRTLNEAKAKRQAKAENVLKRMRVQQDRDALLAQLVAPGAAMSLNGDGTVNDPLAVTLDILDRNLVDVPALLNGRVQLSEQPHPREPDSPGGPISAERAKAVADEMATATGLDREATRAMPK